MKNTIENYGWIIVVLLSISIIIALASPLAIYYSDNIVKNANKIENNLSINIDDKLLYPVIINSNVPEGGMIEFTGDYSGTKIYLRGENIIAVKATPNVDYEFIGWYLGNSLISENKELELKVNKKTNITAKFNKIGGDEGSADNPESKITPGLYETGSNYTNLVYTWEQLTTEGAIIDGKKIIYVENGAAYTNANDEWVNSSSSTLSGDLVLPNDGSITKLGTAYWDDDVWNEDWQQYGAYVGDYAFLCCENLTGVVIPDSVISIGDCAFYGCTSLTNIVIPDSVTNIGNSAFENCENLTDAIIGNGVTNLGDWTFSNCSSLANVTIGTSVISFGLNTFCECTSLTSIGPKDSGASIEIPDNLTSMGSSAFDSCRSLTSVVIPNNVTDIGSFTFSFCSDLVNVVLPNNITSIGDSVFSGCTSLTNIIIPDSVTSIGEGAFSGCNFISVGHVDSGASVEIPDSVISIGDRVFSSCENLISVVIPDTVTNLGSQAFCNCINLQNVVLGNGITSINSGVFSWCEKLQNIIIPDSVTSIDDLGFYGCTGLVNITLPFVGGSADATYAHQSTLFGYVFGTTHYYGGTQVKQYYQYNVFAAYYIPSTLRSVTITGGHIFYGSFYNCSNLTSITIESEVTGIDSKAFYGCSNLTYLTIEMIEPPTFTESMLEGCSRLANIYVPTESVEAYKTADGWSDYASLIKAIPAT